MKITKAVIPAAGLGTRFLPITKAIPKPMLPVVDKPTIQYIVEEAVNAGITDIIVVVSPNTEDIIKHFSANTVLEARLKEDGKAELLKLATSTSCGAKITFVEQTEAKGLGDAILCAKDYLNGEPFALLLGDEIIYNEDGERNCIGQLIDNYEKYGVTTLATMEVAPIDTKKYGNLKVQEKGDGIFKVTGIKEKPSLQERYSNYAIVGRYVIDYEVIGLLEKLPQTKGEVYLTDAFVALAKKDAIDACLFKGVRYDAGDKFGYVKANVSYALLREEMKEELIEYLKEIIK